MIKVSFVTNIILDVFKKILVRFKNAKFGLLFFINIFKIPDFFTDNRVNIFSKIKVGVSLLFSALYIISSIDLVPEIFLGIFGFIDDILVLVWCLGIVSEEIEKYKKILKDSKDPNIIENVNYNIYEENE